MRQGYSAPIRSGYRLILPEWQPLGRSVAAEQFTGLVSVREPDREGAYDQASHAPVVIPGASVLTGVPARLQPIGQSSTVNNAGQMVTTNRYRLSIEYRGDPGLEVDQVATFTGGVSLWLIGRPLVVTTLLLSSLEWQHDVEVEANLG